MTVCIYIMYNGAHVYINRKIENILQYAIFF